MAIPGGIKLLMAELACDEYANPEINDERFPGADAFVSSEGVRPVDIGRNWVEHEALAFLEAMVPPMKPVNPDKGIKWATENPDPQGQYALVIMGQTCRIDGNRCFLVLGVGGRSAYLNSVKFRFDRRCLVLAEPKEKVIGT